jgi:hypothetical protein
VRRARRTIGAGAPVARPILALWLADHLADANADQMSLAQRKLLECEVTNHRGVLEIENGWGHVLYRSVVTPRDYWRYLRRRLEHDAAGWTTAFDGFGQIRAHIAPAAQIGGHR